MEAVATTTLERRVREIPPTRKPEELLRNYDGKMRVAAYCRVSTDSEEQLNSYEAQKTYYTQKIQDNPDWEMAGIYADEGISGTSLKKRAEFHNILTNEKYIGDALLLKTYVTDCISQKVRKNRGERVMYYVENNHPAIVSRETFDLVRKEMTRRSSKRKVLQKSGKTELGKYSGKYALTELLVCGECGSPYKRVTWARDGKKRIVWRCVSRLEFGTKYCHVSPTLDEGKLHHAILDAMNEYAAIRQEVCPDVLAMVEEAKQALTQAGTKLLTLKRRLDEVSHEQADLLDILLSNMADADLNARMKALTDEKASLKEQILEAQQEEVGLEEQVAKRQQMWDTLIECSEGYTEFDDEFIRQIIQKITVEDADTIRIQFRDSDVVLEQGLQ